MSEENVADARPRPRRRRSHLGRALRRAERIFWQTQRPDGSWDVEGDLGPISTAQVLVSLHHLGQLPPEDAKEGARWLRGQQRADGSWVLYPFADKGDVGATASAWAALHVAGGEESRDAVSRARRWLDRQGGEARIIDQMELGDFSAIYLSLAGLLDASRLPCPDTRAFLIPPLVHFLETRFHSGIFMGALQLGILIRRLRGDFGPDGNDVGFLAKAECDALVKLLDTFQNQDGSWNANTLQGALALPALRAAGLPLDDPRVRRGLRWMQSQQIKDRAGLRYLAFGSAVWSTAFDLRALFAMDVPASDPDVQRALGWLVDAQLVIPQPAVDNRNPGAPRTGGWGFQKGNHTMADCDDAGVVFSAFGQALAHTGDKAVDPALAERIRGSIEKGKDWLFGMQNPDGGWSAFVWGLPGKKPGPVMTETLRAPLDKPWILAKYIVFPEPVLGDPSTEDLTSRVLHGLGSVGLTVRDPHVERAVGFLKAQQDPATGGWWGRWVVNYLSATAFVLMGLRAVDADLRQPWIQRGVRFLLSRQNPDGGWGEEPASYRNPHLAGKGPSMAPLTGLVLQALLDVGEGDSDPVKRGVRYLLRQQRPDGTWPNHAYLHTNVPPDTFYYYPEAARFYPAEALGRYRAFKEGRLPEPPEDRWSDEVMDAARGRADPVGDKVVSAVYARGQLAAVNALLGTMFKSDAPIPEGLPEEAKAYFEETAPLPDWADPQKIKMAEDLFARAGWQVATALFCSSLPQAYAAAKGAKVLTQTGTMLNHVRQRIFETAQFIFDVLDEGGLSPGGRGIRTTQKVRLLHAGIRHLILTRPGTPWDAAALGLPVNQEDLAGTLLTFSVVTLDALELTGIHVTEEEQEAWLHHWKVVGHYLGIEEEMMPLDVADAQEQMDTIRERQWAPSEDGRTLIAHLLTMMQEFVPGQALDGVPVALIRYLAGDHCAQILGMPDTDWTRVIRDAAEVFEPLAELGDKELGLSILFSHARQLIMHAVVDVEREGKQAKFRLPESLKRAIEPD